MKAFAIILLCALAAVQGRNTGLQSTRSAAALGENPWVVHLRIAVSTSGYLNTCGGSLIDSRWVLTAASCVEDARYIWLRLGNVIVIHPELVLETSLVRLHPDGGVALVNANRAIESTVNIGPIGLDSQRSEVSKGNVCAFGGPDGPGEQLSCYNIEVSERDGALFVDGGDFVASKYDLGAALVSEGAQVGVLVDDESGKFVRTADFIEWISEETGINFEPEEVAPEAVHFV